MILSSKLEPGLVVSGGLTAVRLGMVAAVKRPAVERIGHAGYRRHPVRRWQLHHRVTRGRVKRRSNLTRKPLPPKVVFPFFSWFHL